jgi:hypothetical protein
MSSRGFGRANDVVASEAWLRKLPNEAMAEKQIAG